MPCLDGARQVGAWRMLSLTVSKFSVGQHHAYQDVVRLRWRTRVAKVSVTLVLLPMNSCGFRLVREAFSTPRPLSGERKAHRATRCTAVAQPSRFELPPSARLPQYQTR